MTSVAPEQPSAPPAVEVGGDDRSDSENENKDDPSSDESEPDEKTRVKYPTKSSSEFDPNKLLYSYIKEDEIKSAFADFINTNTYCCNRPKDAASEVGVLSASSRTFLRFQLSSYVESRSFVVRMERVNRGFAVETQVGRGPDVWAYEVAPYSEWWTGKKEVLTETFLVDCTRYGCRFGSVRCNGCGGDGNKYDGTTCYSCHGRGEKRCNRCGGVGQLNRNKYMVAKYRIIDGFHIEGGETEVPREQMERAQGTPVYHDEQLPPIPPIPPYPHSQTMNPAALRLLELHYNLYMVKYNSTKRILKQRETLATVPVTDVRLSYRGTEYDTWIYGNDRGVHCPEMDTCCMWCCFCCFCMHGKTEPKE